MNEKIKEFALQAGIVYEKRPELDVWIAFNIELEKFAELIVRECADIADEQCVIACDTVFGVGKELLERFGVEE
jgi:hypothetical protein